MAKVAVAMSGGVDSSLAAALLKQRGYQVTGVHLRLFPTHGPGQEMGRGGLSFAQAAVEDARHVAHHLQIPFCTLDVEDEFSQTIISYFVREYLQGRTPNPCIPCNAQIKFGTLLRWSRAQGMDFLASGHYARVSHDPQRGRSLLWRSMDRGKDQSYFLFRLSQEQLARVLWPLGELQKEEVRRLAGDFGLRVADKEESQEVCFVPGRDYRPFLGRRARRDIIPGKIRNREGLVLGDHPGIAYFTIGQRRGLGIAAGHPLYVVGLDPMRNEVIVGGEEDLRCSDLVAEEVHFIPFPELSEEMEVLARIRYRHEGGEARLRPLPGGQVLVEFTEPQIAITPGQAIVFYQDDLVIGGGTIAPARGRDAA